MAWQRTRQLRGKRFLPRRAPPFVNSIRTPPNQQIREKQVLPSTNRFQLSVKDFLIDRRY
jgi:hypothetical protein